MFEQNRQRLYKASNGALIVLAAYDTMQSSGDMEAAFVQESSFWWLTGIDEPGWNVILDCSRQTAVLVRPERSNVDMIFNGTLSDERITQCSGISKIIAASEFEAHLRQLARGHAAAQTMQDKRSHEFVVNPAAGRLSKSLKRIFENVQDCSILIYGLRAIKQPHEVSTMQNAIDLTADAFNSVRENLGSLRTEYEIEAEFTYAFRRANAQHAYQPIVAGGVRACTLHYTANSDKLLARDMVVIDVGAKVDGYCADITRTYCRNPTKRQQAVHAAVENAHNQIIALIKPGLEVARYGAKVDDIMKQALHSIGLLPDVHDNNTYRKYFPHAISHGLGIDPHDSLGGPKTFQPGMVITVEPGIYIPEESIGVRIEDDILVTEQGYKNLSGALSTALN